MTNATGSSATFWRAPESEWRAAVERALGEGDLDAIDATIVRTDDDIPVGPIYGRCDPRMAMCGRERPWIAVQRVDDPDSHRARDALNADLAGGATGIELVFVESSSAERTGLGLAQVDPALIAVLSDTRNLQVRLDAGTATYTHYQRFKNLDLDGLTLSFDPMAQVAARGGLDRPLAHVQDTIVRAARDFQESGLAGSPLVADGRVWAAGGASEAQEIAGIIGSAVHSIRFLIDGGFDPRRALDSIGLVVDAGANQHLTIAKLRALRLCYARVAEALGVAPTRAHVHAETSWRMMTRYDVHTNILRATSAAFAAGIGGADSITLLPFTIAVGLPDAFARRVARNAQAILIEEAGLARVDDPAAGSGSIESLTEAIAEAAWTRFQRLEAAGGLAAALRAGTFQNEIASTRRTRIEKITHREIAITGVSKFPSLERADTGGVVPCRPISKPIIANAESLPQLRAARFAEPFEALRDRAAVLAGAGKPPRIFLANLGDAADFADAAQSAANFFAAGGIIAIGSDGFDTPAEAAQAFSASSAHVACIAGAEEMLRHHAAATARALKANGAARVYVVGGGDAIEAIDAVLGEHVDAVSILKEVLDAAS